MAIQVSVGDGNFVGDVAGQPRQQKHRVVIQKTSVAGKPAGDVVEGDFVLQQGDPVLWRARLDENGTVEGVGLVKGRVIVGGTVIREALNEAS